MLTINMGKDKVGIILDDYGNNFQWGPKHNFQFHNTRRIGKILKKKRLKFFRIN